MITLRFVIAVILSRQGLYCGCPPANHWNSQSFHGMPVVIQVYVVHGRNKGYFSYGISQVQTRGQTCHAKLQSFPYFLGLLVSGLEIQLIAMLCGL